MGLIYCVRWWDNVNRLRIRGIQLVFFVALSLRVMVDLNSIHDQLQTADVSISKASTTIKGMIRQYVRLFGLQGHLCANCSFIQ